MSEQNNAAPNKNMQMPSFLEKENVPTLTKPDIEVKHATKMMEIAEGMDQRDAELVCKVLCRKYPVIMFEALVNEFIDLHNVKNNMESIIGIYRAREEVIDNGQQPG